MLSLWGGEVSQVSEISYLYLMIQELTFAASQKILSAWKISNHIPYDPAKNQEEIIFRATTMFHGQGCTGFKQKWIGLQEITRPLVNVMKCTYGMKHILVVAGS